MAQFLFICILLVSSWNLVECVHNIEDYGAVSDDAADATCMQNSESIIHALLAANASSSDKAVLVPANGTYCVVRVNVTHLNHVTILLHGNISANNKQKLWATYKNEHHVACIDLDECTNLIIMGTDHSMIDGQGWIW